jgi:polyferredoxin
MPLINKKSKIEKRTVTVSDAISVIIVIAIFFSIFLLRYIFPNSPFIMKYFTGIYALTWYVLFWVIVFVVEIIIIPRRRSGKTGSDAN